MLVTSIANKWLDEGLHDRGITRDVQWGVPVPDDIGDGKLQGQGLLRLVRCAHRIHRRYMGVGASQRQRRCWKGWWLGEARKGRRLYQFMGKDNIPFHTVGFPVTIMGSRQTWKLVDRLKGFNYINYYGGKFSTSQKRGVFMDTALEILPADYWRYYLIANAPESSDSNFTWDHFAGVVNKDLADVLGNFVNRITTLLRLTVRGPRAGRGRIWRGRACADRGAADAACRRTRSI